MARGDCSTTLMCAPEVGITRWAHSVRWRAAAPSQTVNHHSLDVSNPCKPSVGSLTGRPMAPRFLLKAEQAHCGAVTLIQPNLGLGSAANLNIHLHCLVLDGVYPSTDGEPLFVEVPAPTDEQLPAVPHKIIGRLMKLLTRRSVLIGLRGSVAVARWPARPRTAARRVVHRRATRLHPGG